MDLFVAFLIGVILILIVVAFIGKSESDEESRFAFPDESEIAGREGEWQVDKLVQKFCNKYDDKKLNGAILLNEKDGRTTEIDILLFSIYGIYVIEVKNHVGKIVAPNADDSWTQIRDDGIKRTHRSPVKQNDGHVFALKKVLGKDYSNCVHGVVVFAQNNAPTGFDDVVCNNNNFCSFVLAHGVEISEQKRDEAYEIVKDYINRHPVSSSRHKQNVNNLNKKQM